MACGVRTERIEGLSRPELSGGSRKLFGGVASMEIDPLPGGLEMKIKALVAVLFLAGLAASFALASPKSGKDATTATETTTTPKKAKCKQVELKGVATGGSAVFTVKKANKRGRSLVGSAVTLVIPANAKVKAKACSAEGGALTLRELHVRVRPSK
jgi:hypothetical protein